MDNVLGVGAPTLYPGPAKSHVSDLFDQIQDPGHLHSIRHGEVDAMVTAIRTAEANGGRGSPTKYAEAVERVGASTLLEKTLNLLEAASPTPLAKVPQLGAVNSQDARIKVGSA